MLVTVPVKPLTLIVEGYGVAGAAAPTRFVLIAVEFVKTTAETVETNKFAAVKIASKPNKNEPKRLFSRREKLPLINFLLILSLCKEMSADANLFQYNTLVKGKVNKIMLKGRI